MLPEFGSVSVATLSPVVAVLRADGHDVAAVLAAGGVAPEQLTDPARRITMQAATRVWQAALRVVPTPTFGIRAALLVESGDLDVLLCLARSCATLEEVLRAAVQLGGLIDESLACSLHLGPRECFFSLGPRSPQYLPAVAEYALLRLITLGRKLLGSEHGVLEAHFAHPRPNQLGAHREAFRTILRFDRSEVGLLLESSAVAAPIRTADPVLKQVLLGYAHALLAAVPPRTSTAQRVRDLLVELLPSGVSHRAQVARQLGVSDRTLSRMLDAEHTNYSALVDELRLELAFRRLQERRAAIGAIAAELGFQDQSAFTKFFKRQASMLPLEYRRRYQLR